MESLMPDIVLDGPGELACAQGIGFTFRDRTGVVYVDDTLTGDEIDLIIGTYLRQPKESSNVRGVAFPAWWPGPVHFDDSALDFGWWSPIAEKWYRALRTAYRAGTGQPKTGPQWRQSIRNWDKRARRFTDHSRDAALTFLQSSLT